MWLNATPRLTFLLIIFILLSPPINKWLLSYSNGIRHIKNHTLKYLNTNTFCTEVTKYTTTEYVYLNPTFNISTMIHFYTPSIKRYVYYLSKTKHCQQKSHKYIMFQLSHYPINTDATLNSLKLRAFEAQNCSIIIIIFIKIIFISILTPKTEKRIESFEIKGKLNKHTHTQTLYMRIDTWREIGASWPHMSI